MPYLRQRAKIPATGRVTVRLDTTQRDWLEGAVGTPRALGHRLHRAPVHKGKLEIRVDREELAALIAAAVGLPVADKQSERAIDSFVRYLEMQEERFADD